MTKQKKHDLWLLEYDDFVRSGLSIKVWCEQNNTTVHQFFYKRKMLGLVKPNNVVQSEFIKVTNASNNHDTVTLLPALSIKYPSGVEVKISSEDDLVIFEKVNKIINV
jgi:hypothetical protein